jgi:hypothetical protein
MAGSFQLQGAAVTGALVMGFLPALWRRLRVRNQTQQPAAVDSDRLERACLFVSLPLMLVAGWAVEAWGPHDVLFAGSVLSALSLATLGMRGSSESLRWLVMMVAGASACLTTATIVIMPHAFLGADDPAASVNLGFVAVGIGYLVLPILADGFCRRLGFHTGMLFLAVVSLAPAVFVMFTARDEVVAQPRNADAVGLLSHPAAWLAGLAAFFYFPLEISLSSWMTDYLKNLGQDSRRLAYSGAFWTIFLASRFVTGQFLVPTYEFWFVLVMAAVAAVTLGNLAGAYGPRSARGLLVLAACLGPLAPSLLGGIIGSSPSPPLALALVYTCGGAGVLVLRPALASPNFRRSMPVGMRIPLAVTVLMMVPLLVLALLR